MNIYIFLTYFVSFQILICRELLLSQGSLNTLDVIVQGRNHLDSSRNYSSQPDPSTRPFTSQSESSNRPFSSQPEASNRSFSSHSSDPLRTYSSYGPEPNQRTQYSQNSYSQVTEKLIIYLISLQLDVVDLLNFKC